jgi:hypothetical protein
LFQSVAFLPTLHHHLLDRLPHCNFQQIISVLIAGKHWIGISVTRYCDSLGRVEVYFWCVKFFRTVKNVMSCIHEYALNLCMSVCTHSKEKSRVTFQIMTITSAETL